MNTNCTPIRLFGTPEVELDEYEPSGPGIRKFAADLTHRLKDISRIADTLGKDGWSLKVVANSLEARHPQVNSVEDAVGRVGRLGIDPEDITDMAEWEDGERLWPV